MTGHAPPPPPGFLDRTWRSLPLDRRLPLLVLGLVAVLLGISLPVAYYEIRGAAEASASERLQSVSRVISSLLQQQLSVRIAGMRHAATDTAVVAALESPTRPLDSAATAVLAGMATRADSLTPVRLLTPAGQPVGGVHLETPADAERMESRALAGAVGAAYVGSWYTTGGHSSFWIAVPVKKGGHVIGFVAQERRLTNNPQALQPFHDLIGPDIALYFSNVGDSTWVDLSGSARRAAPAAGQDHLTTLTNGARALTSSSAVVGAPFVVTAVYPLAPILARPKATVKTLALIALALTVIGGLVAWLISRQMTRPLVELTGAAEAIAQGEYSQRVQARGRDEIGRLGAAFNRMAEQVQVSSDASEQAVIRLTYSAATQEFLAEASRLLAESVSDQTLLADLARYCVPTLADYCSIYVLGDDGAIRRVETAHYDPEKRAAVQELVRRHEPRLDQPGQVAEVILTQKPMLFPRLDPTTLIERAADEVTRRLMAEVGPTSFLCVPLIARGRALGAMAFTMTDSGRVFSQDDLDLAMELARRMAVAIDNGIIYKRSLQLRLEAEAASSAKSDFLAKMSHEIRTPINAMLGYAELLEMGITGPVTEGQSKYLSRIRSSGDHLTSLVNEILDLAKIESGRMDVEPRIASAADVIDAALGLVRPQAAAKNVHVVNQATPDASVRYVGDPQRVQQILANLLANAVKFTPTGGNVFIRAGTERRTSAGGRLADVASDWTCIMVIDSGIGIERRDIERIFQPFVQVENGYTRAHGGTGLGLTISRTLAEMMGGTLSVESEVGHGSRFTLWLPAPSAAALVDG